MLPNITYSINSHQALSILIYILLILLFLLQFLDVIFKVSIHGHCKYEVISRQLRALLMPLIHHLILPWNIVYFSNFCPAGFFWFFEQGGVVSRDVFDSPLDEINNFVFWRNYILQYLSPWLLGSRVVEGATELLSLVESMCGRVSHLLCMYLRCLFGPVVWIVYFDLLFSFLWSALCFYLLYIEIVNHHSLHLFCVEHTPSRSPSSPFLPPSRSLRFSTVPLGIQTVTEAWMLDCLTSHNLIDHFWCGEFSYFVLILLEQRFHPEVLRYALLNYFATITPCAVD